MTAANREPQTSSSSATERAEDYTGKGYAEDAWPDAIPDPAHLRVINVRKMDVRNSIDGINPIGIALARLAGHADARSSESTTDYTIVEGYRCWHTESVREWIEDWNAQMQSPEGEPHALAGMRLIANLRTKTLGPLRKARG